MGDVREALLVERRADGPDLPVHHRRGGDDVGAGAARATRRSRPAARASASLRTRPRRRASPQCPCSVYSQRQTSVMMTPSKPSLPELADRPLDDAVLRRRLGARGVLLGGDAEEEHGPDRPLLRPRSRSPASRSTGQRSTPGMDGISVGSASTSVTNSGRTSDAGRRSTSRTNLRMRGDWRSRLKRVTTMRPPRFTDASTFQACDSARTPQLGILLARHP